MTKLRILVVEDERVVAMDIKDMLETLGYDVPATVASAEQAIEQTETLRPDLVLMDIQLQGKMDGIQASELIRQNFDIPVVYLTGNGDSPTIQRAKTTEPFGYVLKPFDEKNLETAIEMAIYKHAAEKKLRETERWLSGTLRGIGDAVIATDEHAAVTFMNPIAEKLTGWKESEARGTKLSEVFRIVDEDSKQPLADPVQRVLEEKVIVNSTNHSIVMRRDGGETYADHSAAPIRDERDNLCGAVLVFRDVTERKRAQQELLEREEQLRQARKMEAVGQLAGGIAHDFNNTLQAVLGYSDLLLREPMSDSWRKKLKAIKSGGEHAASLTKQLLAFSRKQILQPQVVSLNEIVNQSLVLLRRLVKEDIQILPSLEQALRSTKVDPTQIQQVIMNLAINAADAMPAGGTMIIETRNVTLDENYARNHVSVVPGDYVMLAVNNTGHGIDKAIQSRVFEPFFTTKDKSKGAGIGLATVFGIVKQSGGNIFLYSEPGLGTTFKVYLPVIAERVDAAPKTIPLLPGGTETILLVEDEEAVRAVAKEMLEMSGYNVMVAKDGEEALKVCQQSGPAIDLLLSDVIMPHMNGQELARRALTVKPELKVLFMSGYTDVAIVRHGVLEDNVHFIQKPFSTEDFLAKIRHVLEAAV